MKKYLLVLPIIGLALLLGVMIVVVYIGSDVLSSNFQQREGIIKWIHHKDHTIHTLQVYLDTESPKAYSRYKQHYPPLKKRFELSHDILNPEVPLDSIAEEMAKRQDYSRFTAQNIIYYARKLKNLPPLEKSIRAWLNMGDRIHELEKVEKRIDRYVQKPERDQGTYESLNRQLGNYIADIKKQEKQLMEGLDELTRWIERFLRNITWGLSILLFIGGTSLIIYIYRRTSYHEEKYHQLFTNAEIAIVYLDDRSKVIEINDAFTDLFGYTEEESTGLNLDKILAPPDKREEAEEITNQTLQGESITRTTWRLTKQGERIDVIIGAVPVKIEGRLQGIFGLYYDISELARTQEKLRQSLNEKQLLIQEIHHRVKNNLAVIAGLLQLQINSLEDTEKSNILRDSHSRIYSMAMIHELLYKSEDFSKIAFGDYVQELIDHLKTTHLEQRKGKQQIKLESDDFDLNINQAIPCGLIITELVTNALEHAFEKDQPGTVRITTSKSGDHITLIVSDDGMGMPDQVNREAAIGLDIVESLVQQLEGEIEFRKGADNKGTEVEVRFEREELQGSAGILDHPGMKTF